MTETKADEAAKKEIRRKTELAMRLKTLNNDTLRILSDVSESLNEKPFCMIRSIADDLYVASGKIGKALDTMKVDLARNGVFDENL